MGPADLEAMIRRVVESVLETSTPAGPETLMTRDEVAAYFQITPRQVDLLRARKGLPVRWVASSPRFDRAEIDEWSRSGGGSRRSKSRKGGKDAGSDVGASVRDSNRTANGAKYAESREAPIGPESAAMALDGSDGSRIDPTPENVSTRRQRAGRGTVNNLANPSSMAGGAS